MTASLEPSAVVPPPSRPGDPRVGHLLVPVQAGAIPGETRVAIIGFPSDEGVRINGGRPGASEGPDRIRHWLYRLTPDAGEPAHEGLLRKTVDLGNVRCSGDVAADQERLGRELVPLLDRDLVPIVLGGGHETSFGHFLGHVGAGRAVSILNIDAHADVRPLVDGKPHSGSPFRQALEHPSRACLGYTVVGLGRAAVAREHLEYVEAHGGQCIWNDCLDPALVEDLATSAPRFLATFDLDALDQSHAPGVSAPGPGRLAPNTWFEIARRAGRNERVSSFDVVELNPRHDRDDATARLAALTVWQITRGLAERGEA